MAHIKTSKEFLSSMNQERIIDELYNFACLPKDITKLSVDIYVDEDNSYRHNKHPFLLYAQNGYTDDSEYIGITIGANPQVLCDTEVNLFRKDIIELKIFASHYCKVLKDICESKMNVSDFIHRLGVIRETATPLILEMSKAFPEQTGLPFAIFIGVNPKKHGVGIKFPSKVNSTNSSTSAEMAAATGKIYSENDYEEEKAEWVRHFIEANKNSLLLLNKHPNEYNNVIKNLIRLDNNMNPIEKEPEYRNAGKECFGFIKVINQDGKFNFTDSNGNLFSETWFDVANDFTKTKNGVIHAYVIVDEVDGFLDKKEMRFIPNQ